MLLFLQTKQKYGKTYFEKKKSKSKFSFSIWDGVVGDESGPEDGPGLDDPGAVGLDLGEVLLELQTTASGQSGNGNGI